MNDQNTLWRGCFAFKVSFCFKVVLIFVIYYKGMETITKQQIADEMTRILANDDTTPLTVIKAKAIQNLTTAPTGQKGE